MARSKPTTLIGRTAILAAIYNPAHLPSAYITLNSHSPYCLHGLREADLAFFDKHFMPQLRTANGHDIGDKSHDEELKCGFVPFFEDYPDPSHTCYSCHFYDSLERHPISDSDTACRKTTEECA